MPLNQEVTLPQVVSDRLLIVADYQRPYAWGDKQLRDLWEDIDLLGSSRRHYAGTLVLLNVVGADGQQVTETADDGTSLLQCEVVDGQQRLTTCLLLLDRLRRRLTDLQTRGVERAGEVAANIRSRYLTTTINNAQRPKLTLGNELNEFWMHTILGDRPHEGAPLIAGERRLQDAKNYFDQRLDQTLQEADDATQLGRLLDVFRRVTAGLAFLVYEVRTDAEVGVIFETLNERGRDLTDLEKVKNYLLYLARNIPDDRSKTLAGAINGAWRNIFGYLSSQSDDAEDQLLRAHWLATQNPDTRQWKRITSIKEKFERGAYVPTETRILPRQQLDSDQETAWTRLEQHVTGYVDTLERCAAFQSELLNDNALYENFTAEERQRVCARAAALNRSGVVALYRPLLFAARLRYPEDGAFFADLLDLCERYSARVFVIEQWRSNAGVQQLARLANELYLGRDRQEVLASIREDLWSRAPDDKVFATLQDTTKNWYWRPGHKYVLYEYELDQLAAGETVVPFARFTDSSRAQRTTEHILPQKPDADASCWWEHFSPAQHAALVHSLGNLMLTLDNSEYSNHCFSLKRDRPPLPDGTQPACYKRGKLHQEQTIFYDYTEWTPATVADRQRRLAEWAMRRWAVEPPAHPFSLPVDELETIEAEVTPEDEAVAVS